MAKTNSSANSFRERCLRACGWLLLSFFFSVYLDVFKGFTSMYGSLTTIILIMLWLYGCMYIILLGGEINALLENFAETGRQFEKRRKRKKYNPSGKSIVFCYGGDLLLIYVVEKEIRCPALR